MAGSRTGTLFTVTTFGESHGKAMGGIIDGMPAGVEINTDWVQDELNRRRPGQNDLVTPRNEPDQVEFLSGIFEGRSLGTPIGFLIRNKDQRSADYSEIKDKFRPSHADYTYEKKYGIRDYRGGGRASARETVCRVVAGAIAKQVLHSVGIRFSTYVSQIGPIKLSGQQFYSTEQIEGSLVRCPDAKSSEQMEELIEKTKGEGDTLGGVIQCRIENVPVGLGEPVFDKLHADLAKGMMSINAAKGVEIGEGFDAVSMKGSEHNDLFEADGSTSSNHSGGIQGGISNGMPIVFRVAFKPVATIMRSQQTIDSKGNVTELDSRGRHDVCVVPRAVPIVEAMAAISLLDHYLRNKAVQIH